MDLLKEFLKRNREKKLKIHVAGDIMIDEYYDVKVSRISPEMPMPVMSSANDWAVRKPGGAANVAYQFRHFNVQLGLMCWCDELGKTVLTDHEIPWGHPISSQICKLPIKRRFLDNGIQVVRHDIETPLCGLDEHIVDYSTLKLKDMISKSFYPEVAILSDYDKGFFSSEEHNVLDYYRAAKTIIDPKHGPLSKWKGCTVFKPNAKEAYELTKRNHWKEQAKHLQNELECKSVVITFGGEKVAGVDGSDFFMFKPSRAVVAESVVGAGDCFAAFLAMSVGHGFSAAEAAEIAWNAGANYVTNKRNRPITPSELSLDGLVEPEDLVNRDYKLVFTNGCYDILHEGHIKTLEFAKSKGDKLVVALNSDASVKKHKGDTRPIKPLDQRVAVMKALRMVDFVVIFDEDTPLELIKKIQPDVLVKGAGYCIDTVVGSDVVPEVFIAPTVGTLSTTGFLSCGKCKI